MESLHWTKVYFSTRKKVATNFQRSKHKSGFRAEVILADNELASTQDRIRHFGILLDCNNRDAVTVENRMTRYFAAVNGTVSRLGGCRHDDDVWMKTVKTQLFSIWHLGVNVVC